VDGYGWKRYLGAQAWNGVAIFALIALMVPALAGPAYHAGLNRIALRHRFRFGRYEMRLTIEGAGQRARSAVRVFLGGTLPAGYVRALVVPDEIDTGGGCSNCEVDVRPVRVESHRRFGARRVDWRYSYQSGDRPSDRRAVIMSARLSTVGTVLVREYDAPDRPGIQSPPELGTLLAALPEQP
jgi:hypothetical protein